MKRTGRTATSMILLALLASGATAACSSNTAAPPASSSPAVTATKSASASASATEEASESAEPEESASRSSQEPTQSATSAASETSGGGLSAEECNDVQTLVSQNTGSIGQARRALESGDTSGAIEALKGAEASVSAMLGGLGGDAPGSGQSVLEGLQSMSAEVASGADNGDTPEQILAKIQAIDSETAYQAGWDELRSALEAKCPGLTF